MTQKSLDNHKWRIIPHTNYQFEMNDAKQIRRRGRKNLFHNIHDDFRYIFAKNINEPIPAKTREDIYKLTFNDDKYIDPVIPDEYKTRGEKFMESLKSEGCEPLTEYISGIKKVDYLYDGIKYSVSPNNWMRCGTRPHILRRKFDIEYVKQMFEKHGCELLEDEWINKDTPMKYRHNGTEYINNWQQWKQKYMK